MFFLVYNSILSQKVSYKMGFNIVYHNNMNISTNKKRGLFNPNLDVCSGLKEECDSVICVYRCRIQQRELNKNGCPKA